MHIKLMIAGAVSSEIECPEDTFFLMELQLMLGGDNSDISQTGSSGPDYRPASFDGADVTLRYIKRCLDVDGWAYYNFHHYEPKSNTASMRPKSEYAFRHMGNATNDNVWTQF